jgi:pyruvate kinase
MDFSLIVTVGPAILSQEKISQINSLGDCIFRINGAHNDSLSTSGLIRWMRSFLPSAKIMVDLPGNKVRIVKLIDPLLLIRGEKVKINNKDLNYQHFYKHLNEGYIVYANDSLFKLEVTKIQDDYIEFLSHSDGLLHNNKGLHVQGIHEHIPFLFQNDIDLIKVAVNEEIDFLSLSFVRNVSDILQVKKMLAAESYAPKIFSKIETKSAVDNLSNILECVDFVNIDRGDLSGDIGILNLGKFQEIIIEKSLLANKKIFLATQFLKNMEKNPLPLIAEMVDLYKTIKDGVSGIQLSEETAIGQYPVECVDLVFKVLKNYLNDV